MARAPETFSVAVALKDDGAPPSEFRLFGSGVTATSKGPIVTSPTALSRVMAAVPTHHPDGLLPFDFDHGMVLGLNPSSDSRAAGWFRPEVRGSGEDQELWASSIQWTPRGAQALRDREFRYFSPTLYRDYESGEIEELINVALTNMPATLNQAPLVAHRDDNSEGIMTEKEIAALRAERDSLVAASAAMTAEIAALKAAVVEREARDAKMALSAKVDALCASGKLAPALKSWALTQTVESLDAFAAAAPVLTEKVTPPVVTASSALTAEEIELCSQMRISPDSYAKRRDALKGKVS